MNIRKYYTNYVNNISTPQMAISYELAFYLWNYLKKNKPLKILDLGSGFSSFIFRYYKKNINENAFIVSVDDSDEWLEKTKIFLKNNKLNTENIFSFDDFKKINLKEFDFILYDLGNMYTRTKNLKLIYSYKTSKGVMIIDDIHKQSYQKKVLDFCQNYNISYNFLKNETIDEFNRYALMML